MKNIQVIDSADISVFDIFAATEEEFSLIFLDDNDVAFIDELIARIPGSDLDDAFNKIWMRRVPKRDAMGIHGIFFTGSIIRSNTIQREKMKRHVIPMALGFDKIRCTLSIQKIE